MTQSQTGRFFPPKGNRTTIPLSPPTELPQLPTLVRLKTIHVNSVGKVRNPLLVGNTGYIWRTMAEAMEMT